MNLKNSFPNGHNRPIEIDSRVREFSIVPIPDVFEYVLPVFKHVTNGVAFRRTGLRATFVNKVVFGKLLIMKFHAVLVLLRKRVKENIKRVSKLVFTRSNGGEALQEKLTAKGVIRVEREQVDVLSLLQFVFQPFRAEAEAFGVNEKFTGVGDFDFSHADLPFAAPCIPPPVLEPPLSALSQAASSLRGSVQRGAALARDWLARSWRQRNRIGEGAQS
jgi:hypothetical protein